MPKVYLTKEKRLSERLVSWIYGEMKVQHVTQTQISEAIGIKQSSLNYKLKHGNFSFQDLTIVFGMLKPDTKKLLELTGADEWITKW